jgi:hypothetical protein
MNTIKEALEARDYQKIKEIILSGVNPNIAVEEGGMFYSPKSLLDFFIKEK